MGFGLGAAIGAALATDERVFLVTGDGSFGMNLNELATAVSRRLPIIILLLNNGVLGMVRQLQTLFYDKRYAGTELERATDFVAVAKAFGVAVQILDAELQAVAPAIADAVALPLLEEVAG